MLSIIIPIYNMDTYLERALRSILEQSNVNYEVILIDDGSNDGSAEICKKFVTLDNRFKYFYQKNSGVSAARNLGLIKSRGELIGFVDPDDYISSDYFSPLVESMIDLKTDLCISGYTMIGTDGTEKVYKYDGPQTLSSIAVRQLLFTDRSVYSFLWNKIFRKEVIERNGLLFDINLKYGEDLDFCDRYLRCISRVEIFQTEGYYYFRHEESIGGKVTKQKILDRITYLDAMLKIQTSYAENLELRNELAPIVVDKIAWNGAVYSRQMRQLGCEKQLIGHLRGRVRPFVKKSIMGKSSLLTKIKLLVLFYVPTISRENKVV